MNENRLLDYLEHMLEAARLAISYVEGIDEDDFWQINEPSRLLS